MLKSMSFRTTLVAIACAISMSAHAIADEPKKVDIPAGDLRQALLQLSKQYGADLVYRPEQVTGLKTHGAHGELTTKQAVSLLLEGTPLEVRTDPSGAMLIAPAHTLSLKQGEGSGSEDPPEGAHSSKSSSRDGLQMAEVDQQTPSDSSVDKDKKDDKQAKKETLDEYRLHLPEILVVGSRSLDTDIKRNRDDVQPYYIFDSQTVEQSGASSVEDFLQRRLTMNVTASTNGQQAGGATGNLSSIDLRGLGPNQTLILLNGRRNASISFQGDSQQPDINGIPLAAVERIEVLPASAAAIYGGGAVGGVINIVLRHNYIGGEARLLYDDTWNGNAPVRTVDAVIGTPLEGGRTHLMLSGHYSDAGQLLAQDRPELIQRSLTLRNTNTPYPSPYALYGFFPFATGATANIGAFSNLTLKNGTPLNSPFTFVPSGFSATSDPAALVANAGRQNLKPPHTSQSNGDLQAIEVAPRIKSAILTLHREMSANLELFTEFSYSSNRSRANLDTSFPSFLVPVPAAAPTNPFQQSVNVAFPFPSAGATVADNVVRRSTTGLTVRLPRSWSAETDFTWAHDEFVTSQAVGDNGDLETALASGTINPFVDTQRFPLDLTPYMGSQVFTGGSSTNDLGLHLAGPVGHLPGGAPNLSVGIEYRKESNSDAFSHERFPNFPAVRFDATYPGQSEKIKSVYAETELPVVAAQNALAAVQQLDLQFALRWDDYSISSTTTSISGPSTPVLHSSSHLTSTNPTVGLRYRPIRELMIRASYGTSFLPPTFSQLAPQPPFSTLGFGVTDPRRGNEPVGAFQETFGGNPNLRPEKSRSLEAGIVLEPRSLESLRLALDWYRIEKRDNIASLDVATILSDEALFPGRVTRGPVPPGDPFGVGRITAIDVSLANLTRLRTEGYDLSVDYRTPVLPYGRFRLFALGTLIRKFERQSAFAAPLADVLNYPALGTFGGPIKHKANASLTWEVRRWNVGWSARYFGSYKQVGPPLLDYLGFVVQQGSDHIPSQTYHDVWASYKLESTGSNLAARLTDKLEIRFGVKNVFNTVPPFDAIGPQSAYSGFGDPRLRDYWLSAKTSF